MTSTVRVVSRSAVVRAAIMAAGERAIRDVTETALTEANRTVPYDEGTLMRSGFTDIEVTPARIRGAVGYDTPYAVRQHEDPELHHEPPRRDHWLLRTIQERQDAYTRHVVGALRDVAL